jgi:hypothetical protein
LHGDPAVKLEKPYTIVNFPGGHVEISRTSANLYWVHIAVHREGGPGDVPGSTVGRVVDARVDAQGRYLEKVTMDEIAAADFEHIALLVEPGVGK